MMRSPVLVLLLTLTVTMILKIVVSHLETSATPLPLPPGKRLGIYYLILSFPRHCHLSIDRPSLQIKFRQLTRTAHVRSTH